MFASPWYGRFVRKYNLTSLAVVSFLTGCACEFIMVKWNVGGTNFYDTVIEKETRKAALLILDKEQKGF